MDRVPSATIPGIRRTEAHKHENVTQQSRRQPVPSRRTLAAALAIVGAAVVALVGAQSVRADGAGDVRGRSRNVTLEATSAGGAPLQLHGDRLGSRKRRRAGHLYDHLGSTFPLGVTTVNCDATDPDPTVGTVSTSFTVTVVDTTPPVVSVPPNITGVRRRRAPVGRPSTFAGERAPTSSTAALPTSSTRVGVDLRHSAPRRLPARQPMHITTRLAVIHCDRQRHDPAGGVRSLKLSPACRRLRRWRGRLVLAASATDIVDGTGSCPALLHQGRRSRSPPRP